MKRFLAIALAAMLAIFLVACGGGKAPQSDVSQAPKADSDITVGFVIRTLDSPYYVALGETVEELCKEEGWNISVLDSNGDTEKEAENVDAFISQGVDLLFFDAVIPDPAVPVINKAYDAGIGVINLDTGVGEEAKDITTVYSDNEQNGRLVGLAYAEKMGDEPIKAILLSGNKGSVAGEQRRTGMFCGIIEARAGLSEEEAWEAAHQFEADIVSGGKAEYADANFVVAGQGWGDWTEEGGLEASEDLITANKDLNCVLAENDQMIFGAMTALENANIEDVDLVAGADGAQRAYDYIREGKQFATGENSPTKVAMKGVEIAREILVDGVDMWSYPEITHTEAYAVTADNVDEHYEYGF